MEQARPHHDRQHPKAVRQAALGRFGFDFDDKAAYPSIVTALFASGVRSVSAYLAARAAGRRARRWPVLRRAW